VKIYAAYAAARQHRGQPTVILAQTKKGYGMGHAGQGKMTTHQQKKLDERGAARLPRPLRAAADRRRRRRGAAFSSRPTTARRCATCTRARGARRLPAGAPASARRCRCRRFRPCAQFALEADGSRDVHHDGASCRCSAQLLKDAALGPRIVPIVADEARTFGMANLFRQVGIYSPSASSTSPRTRTTAVLQGSARRPDPRGGHHRGRRAGVLVAAATSYSVHGLPMLPFYIYYSMFGFQRVGDLIWAAADQRARGFLLGATAGRTTLSGEGLQHQDGSSPGRRDRAELPRLRPGLRLRARGDRRGRHAPACSRRRRTCSTTSP
jgi:pyruvate dehydrogenase E1 component